MTVAKQPATPVLKEVHGRLRDAVASNQHALQEMREGRMELWRIVDGNRVDYTQQEIADLERLIDENTRLMDVIDRDYDLG